MENGWPWHKIFRVSLGSPQQYEMGSYGGASSNAVAVSSQHMGSSETPGPKRKSRIHFPSGNGSWVYGADDRRLMCLRF